MTPDDVCAAVERHPAVRSVTLCGSRARGDATSLSDWDYEVRTDDFGAVKNDLPSLIAPLAPLTTLWDPLAEHATYMLILRGPAKVDLIFDEPFEPVPPYDVGAETLDAIDSHFWDWCLWLVSKRAAGKDGLVGSELRKMAWYILSPMGIEETPTDLSAAVDLYLEARGHHEKRTGVHVPRELGSEVARVVRQQSEAS